MARGDLADRAAVGKLAEPVEGKGDVGVGGDAQWSKLSERWQSISSPTSVSAGSTR